MIDTLKHIIKTLLIIAACIAAPTSSSLSEAAVPDITYKSSTSSPYSSAQLEYTKAGTYTWTVPSGVNQIKVTTVGAGGGAGGFQFIQKYTGYYSCRIYDGGGGGAVIENVTIDVIPGTKITIVVGKGGETVFPVMDGYYAATFRGGTGGNSYIQINSQNYAIANGGTGSYNTVNSNANTTSRGSGKAGGAGGGDGGVLNDYTDWVDGHNGKYGQGGKSGYWLFTNLWGNPLDKMYNIDGKEYLDVSSGGGSL